MGQYNIYAADDELNIDVNVEPLTLDTLENSKTAAEASAETARQCAETATEALNDITDYKNSLELYYAQASDNLTTLLNNSLASLNFCKQGIQTLGNTVLSSINSAYNSIVEYIQTLGQGYVNQAKYYADEARDTVDNRVSLEHLNQSKALETGDVSDDSAVLHQLNRFVCSTFDNTKFTVVGSPVITDDGIASGFSDNNYVRIDTIPTKAFDVEYNFNTGNYAGAGGSIFLFNYPYRLYFNPNEYAITMSYYDSNGTIKYVAIGTITANANYKLKLHIENGNFKSKLINLDTTVETSNTYTNFYTNYTDLTNIRLMNGYFGSIDLKQFSITVDGVSVFSGNKTGIDTIKPDDYTVVGTPTISADGIASGFSEDNNYVLKTLNLSNASSLRIEFANIYCPRQTTERHKAFFEIQPGSNSSYFGLRFFRNFAINGGLGAVYPTSSGGATVVDLSPSLNTAENFSGYIEIKNNILSFVINDTACGSYELTTEQLAYIFTNVNLSIGATTHSGSGQYLADGSIDLNAFKIYIDGNLLYQPCLKIPYTYAGNGKGYNASTGSKVVQSIYRDRVSDMYEQFGYAPYYTLSESDFTLPMGELYGMIENLRKLIIDRTTQAGV